MKEGVYTFLVSNEANKVSVKQAFEQAFGEKVADVNMVRIQKKTRLIGKGKVMEKRSRGKKAIIRLKDNKKIDIFQSKK